MSLLLPGGSQSQSQTPLTQNATAMVQLHKLEAAQSLTLAPHDIKPYARRNRQIQKAQQEAAANAMPAPRREGSAVGSSERNAATVDAIVAAFRKKCPKLSDEAERWYFRKVAEEYCGGPICGVVMPDGTQVGCRRVHRIVFLANVAAKLYGDKREHAECMKAWPTAEDYTAAFWAAVDSEEGMFAEFALPFTYADSDGIVSSARVESQTRLAIEMGMSACWPDSATHPQVFDIYMRPPPLADTK